MRVIEFKVFIQGLEGNTPLSKYPSSGAVRTCTHRVYR